MVSVNLRLPFSPCSVPLVDAQDHRAALFVRVAGDGRIQSRPLPSRRIQHQHRRRSPCGCAGAPSPRSASRPSAWSCPCAGCRRYRRTRYSTPSCNTRLIHRVARGAGHRRNNRPLRPTSAFSSVDFPTFGRPMIATLIGSRLRAGSAPPASALGKIARHVLQQIVEPDPMLGGNRETDPGSRASGIRAPDPRAPWCRSCSPPASRACQASAASSPDRDRRP